MKIDERRSYKRYNAQEGAFVALHSNHQIGRIKDISKGGVSFTCISSGLVRYDISVLEIFSKNNNFYLKEVPFKVVSEINMENNIPCSSLPMKQISGKFAELTEYQNSQLDSFLQNIAATETV